MAVFLLRIEREKSTAFISVIDVAIKQFKEMQRKKLFVNFQTTHNLSLQRTMTIIFVNDPRLAVYLTD